jgi:hypothetical protein
MMFAGLAMLTLALPAPSQAKPWQGITPGQSRQEDVLSKFGEPSTQGKLGGRTAVVYRGEQAIPGTKQAQFFVSADGKVDEITVFPATTLDKESVEGTYGKNAHKTFTEDFKPVWNYKAAGIVVFFAKDGNVEAISFRPPEGAKPGKAEKQAAAP